MSLTTGFNPQKTGREGLATGDRPQGVPAGPWVVRLEP